MKSTECKCILTIAIAVLCGRGIAWGTDFWYPPWDQSKAVSRSHRVRPRAKPFEYDVFRGAPFDSQQDAEAWRPDVGSVIRIEKQGEDAYWVFYHEPFTLKPALSAAEEREWTSKERQYALYRALLKSFRAGSCVEKATFYQYGQDLGRDRANVERSVRDIGGQILKTTAETAPDGTVYHRVFFRRPIDLLQEAQYWVDLLAFVEEYSLIEELAPHGYHLGLPIADTTVGIHRSWRRGVEGDIRYDDAKGVCIANIRIMHADDPVDFDHDMLGREIAARRQLKVEGDEAGRVIISIDGGHSYLWPVNDRLFISTGRDERSREAYLARYPSSLPVGYRIDRTAWCRAEVTNCMRRLEASLEADVAEGEQSPYQIEYRYLLQLVEPIEGAPMLFPSIEHMTRDQERYHFARVSAWWARERDRFVLRIGAPIHLLKVDAEGAGGIRNVDQMKEFQARSEAYWQRKRNGDTGAKAP